MSDTNNGVLTSQQVADLLGVSLSWVYLHIQPGAKPRLPHLRMGTVVRFRRSQIEEFLQNREEPASQVPESPGVGGSAQVG